MAAPPPRELLEFLYPFDPTLQSLALALRRLVLAEMAPCHEYIFTMRSKVVLLYGATERVIKDNVCAISVFTAHVNLGFRHGADFSDTRRMLRGTGKTWRHIRLTSIAEIDPTALRGYFRDARKRAGIRRRRRAQDDVVTRVKPPKGPVAPELLGRVRAR